MGEESRSVVTYIVESKESYAFNLKGCMMSLKILHTADVHLGLKFAQFSDLKTDLVEARLNTLQQLGLYYISIH